jgi:sulfide:quinone oxidoreductase
VAGGFVPVEDTSRPERQVLPAGVRWIHSRITAFHPEAREVELLGGDRIGYAVLIVALGIELRWTAIPGLLQALGRDGVISIYGRRFAAHARRVLETFQGGTAIFTEPETPIKCGGAPQKILHLAHDRFQRRSGVGVASRYLFCTAKPSLFPVPAYAERMARIAADHGAEIRLGHRLVEVIGGRRLAVFETLDGADRPRRMELRYDLLHVVPPMTANPVAAASPLAAEGPGGWVDVDPHSCRHRRFGEVFAIGDVGSFPTAKTAAAVRKQAPVIARNVLAVLDGRAPAAVYDGYSACPLITSDHTVMLMEFDYTLRPVSSFLVDPVRERWSLWLLERFGFAWIYWNRMLRGLPHEGGWLRPLEPLARALGLCRWQRRERRRPIPGSVQTQGG